MTLSTMAANGTALEGLSPQERVEFTPEHYTTPEGTPDAVPVYILRPLSRRARRRVGSLVQRQCGLYPGDEELFAVERDAAIQCLEPEEGGQVAALIVEWEDLAGIEKPSEEITKRIAELEPQVSAAERRLSRVSQTVRDAIADRAEWQRAIGEVTVRACVVDWRGLRLPCVRKDDLVVDAALDAIPDDDWTPLVSRCLSLKEVSPSLGRESASP